jgi:hypothetical protein
LPRQKKLTTPSSLLSTSKKSNSKKNVDISGYRDLTEGMQYVKISQGLYQVQYKNIDSKLQYTRQDIIDLIDNKNIKGLRQVSRYFLLHSGMYKRLILHQANMLTFDYLVIPAKQTYRRMKDDKFKTYFDKSLNFVDDLFIKDTFSKINELVFVNGAFYGYFRELGDTRAIQELPIDYCRTRAKVDGVYQVQFDIRYFNTFRNVEERQMIIDQYPSEFLEFYVEYLNNGRAGLGLTEPWFYDLSPEFAMCYQYDDFGIPFFVGVFEDLVELESYRELKKIKTKMDLKKLIVQKLPMNDETGDVLLELPDAQALHANLVKMLQGNDYVDGISSPCAIDALNLQDNSAKSQEDTITMAERNVFNDAGFSQSILNATGNLSLKISVQNDEAISFRLLDFYTRWINNKLSYIVPSNNYDFEIFLPPITFYNRSEMVTMYTTQATYGYGKLLPPVVAGTKQSTVINMIYFEDYLGLDTLLKPLMSSHTTSGADNTGGKPKSDETNLTEAGSATANTGGNENRV